MKRLIVIVLGVICLLCAVDAHAQGTHTNGCFATSTNANCTVTGAIGDGAHCVYVGGKINTVTGPPTATLTVGGTSGIATDGSLVDSSNGITIVWGHYCGYSSGNIAVTCVPSASICFHVLVDEFNVGSGGGALDSGTAAEHSGAGSAGGFNSTAGGSTSQAHDLVWGYGADEGNGGTTIVTPGSGFTQGVTNGNNSYTISEYMDSGSGTGAQTALFLTNGANGPIKDATVAAYKTVSSGPTASTRTLTTTHVGK